MCTSIAGGPFGPSSAAITGMSYVPFKLQNICVAYCELVTGTCYYTFGYSKDHSVLMNSNRV
jgi:hypothetical protein